MSDIQNQGSQPSPTSEPATNASQPAQPVNPSTTPQPPTPTPTPAADPFALDPRLLGTIQEGTRPEHTATQQPDIVRQQDAPEKK